MTDDDKARMRARRATLVEEIRGLPWGAGVSVRIEEVQAICRNLGEAPWTFD